MIPWEIDATELVNCNCNYGCPCQFNSLPTYGNCEAALGFIIHKGHYGDVKLDGVKAALTLKWPGPIHAGDGTAQLIIDTETTPEQRDAIQSIFTGGDTEDMATMFWVYNRMSPNQLETLIKPIDAEVDIAGRKSRFHVEDVFDQELVPIRNKTTGAEVTARINLPFGFEYRFADMASGTTKTTGAISLEKNNASHAHFCRVYMNGQGVIEHAA